jgi:hypothetical protein
MNIPRLAAFCLLCLLGGAAPYAATPAPKESQVKAVYLNGYAKFIRWPENAFASEDAPFRICVLGENSFGNALNLTVAGETLHGRAVQAEYIASQAHIPTCQILYISDSEQLRLDAILSVTQQYPVLTVSDLDDFVQKGGMIQFYTRGNTIRFLIDPATLREAGLEPNANLLRIADVVKH